MYSRIAVSLLSLSCLLSPPARAQTLETMPCNNQVTTSPSTQRGGRYITAQGTLNVLFVYVEFPDNNYAPSSPNWPKGGAPTYLNQTVDQVWSQTPTPGCFTDYFNQMSFNTLRITGRADTITTPHTRAWYLQNGWQAGAIHREVLQQLDTRTDFTEFDQWHFNSEYNLTNISDHVVDMIFMMWRDIASDTTDPPPPTPSIAAQLDLLPGGYADLGRGTDLYVDNGVDTIRMGYYGYGSGVTVIFGRNSGLDASTIWTTARHEFGHWLLGGNEYHTQLGTWGLVNGFGSPSGCMNSFERERLGWMNFNTIDDISTLRIIRNVTLPDFVTTGIAYRIKVPGGGADEWYLLENHQRTSTFDIPDNNVPTAKGLFALHQGDSTGNTVGVISAQGRFTWTVPYQLPNIYGSNPPNLPVFRRESSSRVNGYSKRQFVPWTWQGVPQPPAAIHYHLDYVTGALHQAPPTIFTGDGQDQFDIGYNNVFSPASNPSSDIYNDANKIAFQLMSTGNGISTLNIYINNVDSTSPSKPQDLQLTVVGPTGQGHPRLTWTANIESDMASYKIYRTIGIGGFYTVLATVPHPTTSYDDTTVHVGNADTAYYKITAVDNQSLESVFSDAVWFQTNLQQKIFAGPGEGSTREVPSVYAMGQNYPNPFNPSTILRYQIPEDGRVTLKVFDILGREVATIVQEAQQAGYYSATFDARNLSAGVYFARFITTDDQGRLKFSQVNKLILAK